MLEHGLEIRLHLRGGHAGFDSAHHLEPPVCGALQQRDVWLTRSCRSVCKLAHEREWRRDVWPFTHGLLHVNQIRRDDADNRHGRVVQQHRLANHLRIAAESRTPVPRANHSNGRSSRLVVLGHDRTSRIRRQPEHAVVVAGRHEGGRDVGDAAQLR